MHQGPRSWGCCSLASPADHFPLIRTGARMRREGECRTTCIGLSWQDYNNSQLCSGVAVLKGAVAAAPAAHLIIKQQCNCHGALECGAFIHSLTLSTAAGTTAIRFCTKESKAPVAKALAVLRFHCL